MKPSFLNLFMKTHARPGRPDHLGKDLLTDLCRDHLWPAFLSEVRQQKEKPCEALFTGVEQLIDKVLFNTAVARERDA